MADVREVGKIKGSKKILEIKLQFDEIKRLIKIGEKYHNGAKKKKIKIKKYLLCAKKNITLKKCREREKI